MKRSKPNCIIGIGSSAGGVEALKVLFRHMPSDSGAAFVILQHLSPNQESLMPQILSRITTMPVAAAEDGTKLEPNHVYVMPSHLVLTYKDGRLHDHNPGGRRASYTPIDNFFNSLADELGESAIGIILSGTGSDGTVGLRSIKGYGGVTIVQRPDTAAFDSMPRSAILHDVVDFELSLEEIATKIGHFCSHLHKFWERSSKVEAAGKFEEDVSEPLKRILTILKRRVQHDFQQYKKNTIIRRIQRRMHVHQLNSFEEYARFIEKDAAEAQELFNDVLIGVTHFNRDPEAWQALADQVIPQIIQQADRQPEGFQAVRVWVPACSTGEEAYMVAILIQEYLDKVDSHREVKIFATDIDPRALDIARRGTYPEGIAEYLSQERLERFFIKDQYLYRVKKEIRDMCIFSVHNVINNSPFSKVHLICCRNLMIYFEQELQKKLLPVFHYALVSAGYLFVGMSENVSASADLFRTVDKNFRIFQSKDVLPHMNLDFPTHREYPVARIEQHLRHNPYGLQKESASAPASVFERIILSKFTPASCVVNEKGDIVYTVGSVGRFLDIPPGEPKMNIITMAREGVRLSLRTALHAVIKDRKMVEKDVQSPTDGSFAKVTVRPLPEAGDHTDFFLVVFRDIEKPVDFVNASSHSDRKEDQEIIAHLEAELSSTREYLEATIEKLETANEELKSSNEELLSMNEELHSSNEELQTSKEELHSMNEELQTVNADASRRVDELDAANSNLQNLYASTQIATLFLDNNLRIRGFTPHLQDMFRVIETDIGRPITDIASRFSDGDFVAEAKSVLRTLERKISEVKRSHVNEWYTMQITPYRTVNNKIDGVTVSFFDITSQKQAQEEISSLNRDLQNGLKELETVFDLVPVGLIISYHPDGPDIRMNQTGRRILGLEDVNTAFQDHASAYGFYIDGKKLSAHDLPMFQALESGREASTAELQFVRVDDKTVHLHMAAMPLFNEEGSVRGVIAAFSDITSLRTVQMELKRLNETLEQRVEDRTKEASQRALQLRRLAAQLFRVEQEERRKLSLILHDHLQQLLVSAKMRLRHLEAGEKASEITDILDEAIHSAKNLTVQLRPPVDFSQGISSAFEWLVRWAKRELHLDVEWELRGEDAVCPEDFGYFLFQSARELLFNVSKHAGVDKACITLHCYRDGQLVLEVRDAGRGISHEDRGKYPERGFGLFSLKERVDIIGGTCRIQSEKDKGTVVTLSFPEALSRGNESGLTAGRSGSEEICETAYAEAKKIIGPIKVLLVDDHQVVREGFSTMISGQKNMCVVGQAQNGQEAVELAKKLRPHVILMDLTLPDMSGVEATHRIKQRFPHIHVIGLSMHEKESMEQKMREAGASAYVTKVEASDTLIEAINACTLTKDESA